MLTFAQSLNSYEMNHKNNLVKKLRDRYKVLILKDDTSVEKLSFRIPFWVFISGILSFLLVLFIVFTLVLRYTPLREYVSGEGIGPDRRELLKAYSRIDSLEKISIANERYLANLKNVIDGTVGETIQDAVKRDNEQELIIEKQSVDKNTSAKSRKKTEDEEVLSLLELRTPVLSNENTNTLIKERSLSDFSFYSPVKGMISSSYDKETRHFATDIATKRDEPIQSIQDGHVIFSAFTPSTGYVIIIQHANNLISVYKHCSSLLKKEGVFVRGGEVIALVGNTGELSTGPHLHFELWHNGNPVNAEDYINF